MSKDKNTIDPSYYTYMSSNTGMQYHANENSINESDEKRWANDDNTFNAIVLSSKLTAAPNAESENKIAPNQIYIVDLGDGVERLAMRIRCLGKDFKPNAPGLPTNSIINPFDSNLQGMQKERAIGRHPVAYTADSKFIQESYTCGTIVEVFYDGSRWYITKNLSSQAPELSAAIYDNVLAPAGIDLQNLKFSPSGAAPTAGSASEETITDKIGSTWSSFKNLIADKTK